MVFAPASLILTNYYLPIKRALAILNSMTIDYTKYTLDELIDVEAHIDKNFYPERYKEVQLLIKALESQSTPIEDENNILESASLVLQPLEPWLSILAFLSFIFIVAALQAGLEFITVKHVIIVMWLWGISVISRVFSKKHFNRNISKSLLATIIISFWFLILFIATINLLLNNG
ncbi:hypothetical protein [Colwellia sp. 12G3]|uniref:hypothetical protein n=1 Tax=Colwellia sp. 12G3 TaxID=2058299 RepID=UPI000C31D155|nr:hypothetical protein [Colwellia sp. 12G3]PKI16297.1 hypothetical protein CXF71_10055 [Colwellia sp. 12G3]